MGTPDTIIEEDTQESTTGRTIVRRKLYRDTEYAMLGGVASGLAIYIDVPRSVIRLFFILLIFAFGSTVFFYIILWIVIPKAVTPKQKMEMKGERINVSNIEKNIRDTCNNVKKNSRLKRYLAQLEENLTHLFNNVGNIACRMGKAALCLLSIGGMVIGIFALLATGIILFSAIYNTPPHYLAFARHIAYPVNIWIVLVLGTLLFSIPWALLTYLSLSHLLNWHKGRSSVFICCSITWGIVLIISLTMAGYHLFRLASHSHAENIVQIHDSDTTLNVMFENAPDNNLLTAGSDSSSDSHTLHLTPNIRFRQASGTTPEISIEQEARGLTKAEALKNANRIEYPYRWKNDTLHLKSHFNLPDPQWHFEEITVTIFLPEGYRINLLNLPQQGIDLRSFKNRHKFLTSKYKNRQYLMEQDKLIEI